LSDKTEKESSSKLTTLKHKWNFFGAAQAYKIYLQFYTIQIKIGKTKKITQEISLKSLKMSQNLSL